MKTALITGALGQDGFFLVKKLLESGNYHIICTSRSFKQNINSVYKHENIDLELLDIENECAIFNTVKKYKPDELYHLASFSAPILSWDNPKDVISINGNSTMVFLEAIRLYSNKTKFFFPSSGKIFGSFTETPQTEDTPVEPKDPYSLGKYVGHQAVKLYRNKFSIFACNGILYNHESHLKNVNFVVYKICHFAQLLKQKKIESFSLLNLNSSIDLGDPRDYVDAMNIILQQDSPDDYIIAMNTSISIKEICLLVGKLLDIPDILSYIKVEQMSNKQNRIVGDNTKLKKIGWSPRYNTEDALRMILNNI
ncbi:MAG: GDP-mannose 4,6-dehydratase [Candidatus Roizmanbacteria bacterium]|nr:GDP-mannose 4,6-dehydratase [Candidatus Roizmanbacteria bacterium]